jgi:hypothetical protein
MPEPEKTAMLTFPIHSGVASNQISRSADGIA